MADYHRNIRDLQGVDIEVAAGPTVRRLQALAMMGWGVQYIADCTGRLSNSYLAQLRSGSRETTRRSTEASVKAVYSHLCLVRNDTSGGRRAVYWARKNGWLGPADWVDIDRGIIDG